MYLTNIQKQINHEPLQLVLPFTRLPYQLHELLLYSRYNYFIKKQRNTVTID